MGINNPIYFGKAAPSAAAASELIQIVTEAVLTCQSVYASDRRQLMVDMAACPRSKRDDLYNERYPEVYANYCRAIIATVKKKISNNEYALSRMDEALSHPELYGFAYLNFAEGELAGFVFAAFWYAITDDPNGSKDISNIMIELNSLQKNLMDGTIEELRKENKKSSSWPYWIAMLVIGIIIGIISRSCS